MTTPNVRLMMIVANKKLKTFLVHFLLWTVHIPQTIASMAVLLERFLHKIDKN